MDRSPIYKSEPIVADDYKGVGPFIMAALELRTDDDGGSDFRFMAR